MRKMLTVTIENVMSWNPCARYDRDEIMKLFSDKIELSALDIIALDIPTEDKFWAILRPELIPENTLHELACDYAEYSLPIWEKKYPDDKWPRLAIEAKRKWLKKEITDDELSAAESAAWSAAWSAARSAACSVAESAALSAVSSAALLAALSTASSALLAITKRRLEAT
jgi:hypothetical protein